MKIKVKLMFFYFAVLTLLLVIPNQCLAEPDIGNVSTSRPAGGSNVDCENGGCIISYSYGGMRITLYNEKGKRVSNSVDLTLNDNVYNSDALTTINNNSNGIGKIDYINKNGKVGQWVSQKLSSSMIEVSNPTGTSSTSEAIYSELAEYYFMHGMNGKVFNKLLESVSSDSNYSTNYNNSDKVYAVFEPTALVYAYAKQNYYGTAYELANTLMKSNCERGSYQSDCWESNSQNLNRFIRYDLPLRLKISGVRANRNFYKNTGLTSTNSYCVDTNNCLGGKIYESTRFGRSEIMNKGIGISVYDYTGIINKKIPKQKSITCSASISINECGESKIEESSQKECVSDNKIYSYVAGQNLYCSDKIETDFSSFYNTFKGDNRLNALIGGRYVPLAGNPTIKITKTCYQSSSVAGDLKESFTKKLEDDYKTNEITLNVDSKNNAGKLSGGYDYKLTATPSIDVHSATSATVTYSYALMPNVNKFINIKTWNQDNVTEKNTTNIDNGGPTIITKVGQLGKYNYYLDLSNSVLNKYADGSKMSTLVNNNKEVINDKYKITNDLSIKYNSSKNNYTKSGNVDQNDLYYGCSYVKYDNRNTCVCKENTCCDSVACKPIDCPNACVCTSPTGCYDDGKCTPIPNTSCDPNKLAVGKCCDANGKEYNCPEACNPEKENCLGLGVNVVYRPISLANPFPGIDGTGRTPGLNWNKIVKINNSEVNLVDYYITNNRGYKADDVYNATPLYVIDLSPNQIKEIKKYNDKHDYSDFALECEKGSGNYCTSKFVHSDTSGLTSGTCSDYTNASKEKFESCYQRGGK